MKLLSVAVESEQSWQWTCLQQETTGKPVQLQNVNNKYCKIFIPGDIWIFLHAARNTRKKGFGGVVNMCNILVQLPSQKLYSLWAMLSIKVSVNLLISIT